MPPLQPGDKAPTFTLEDQTGTKVKLSDFKGRKVLVYFYPKADTPGCTTQACGLRDAFPRFGPLDAVVLGVSPDDVKSHRKFREKYQLPFNLLADTEHAVADQYGVWQEKSMYGRKYWGNARTTVIVGRDGRVAEVMEKVKPETHAEEVAAALQRLG